MRYVAILAVLLATVATASAADTDKLSPREAGRFVRVLYLAPADRDFRADFESSIATAVASVHRWYREQLDGSTFAVYRPMAERCRLPEDSDYYSHGNVWEKVLRAVQSCAPVRDIGASGGDINAAQVVWVLYVDATERLNCDEPQELGRGGLGLTMLPREDLELMVQPGTLEYCDGTFYRSVQSVYGGLAHELGHAFGLPHPPGCDEGSPSCDTQALMWDGYGSYPNTYLRDDEKAVLLELPFIGPDGMAVAPTPTMLTLSAASAPAEGGNPVTVTATLDNPAPANGLTMTLTTSGTATLDTDYTLSSTTITLAEGETAGTVTITVTDDAEDDDGETIVIDAESTSPALAAEPFTLTIEDNDGPAPTMLTLSAASAPAEGGNPVTVTATLDNPAPANGLTVTLTTSGTATLDTDYMLSSTTITLAAGETAGTVTITVTDDAEDDAGETIVIDAESTNPALTAEQLTLTIEDNDVTPVPALPLGGAMLLGLLLTLLGAVRVRMRDRTDIAQSY